MNIAIVGCGFIGQKRAKYLGRHRLVIVADLIPEKAQTLACSIPGTLIASSWEEAVRHSDVEVVIIATTHNQLSTVTMAAIKAGKHVLVDKPAGCSAEELDHVISTTQKFQKKVRVGFNHRYHPALQKAYEIVQSGALGPLYYVRGRYGHGGRPGYEKEWRADPEVGCGGELLDQGMHLIDLSRWFLGDFVQSTGFVHTYYWDMPVEDNGFLMLKTQKEQVAWLHVSWTEWKNIFSFEIYGKEGKLQIDGLGGSYGVEQLTFYKMLPQMGPPETMIWQYPGEDLSWKKEFEEFIQDIESNKSPRPGLEDAREALRIIRHIYEGNGK